MKKNTNKSSNTEKTSSRNTFRKKRGDTKLGTIEKQYGIDFKQRSDMKLETYLDKKGFPSLSKALKEVNKPKKQK